MNLNAMIKKLKQDQHASRIGMIACHLGIVRGTSRRGGEVSLIEVRYDHEVMGRIVEETKALPGIVNVLVETREGRFHPGDDILAVAVAGDIREHVFTALTGMVNRIKSEAAHKKECMKS